MIRLHSDDTSQKAPRTAFRGALFCASMDTNFVLPGDIISYVFFFQYLLKFFDFQ